MNAAHLDAGEYWSYAEQADFLGVTVATVRTYASDYTPAYPAEAIPGTGVRRADDVRAWHAQRRGPGWRKGKADQ